MLAAGILIICLFAVFCIRQNRVPQICSLNNFNNNTDIEHAESSITTAGKNFMYHYGGPGPGGGPGGPGGFGGPHGGGGPFGGHGHGGAPFSGAYGQYGAQHGANGYGIIGDGSGYVYPNNYDENMTFLDAPPPPPKREKCGFFHRFVDFIRFLAD